MASPVASFRAVPRSKVYTAIVEQILENIRAGVFPPGSSLPAERVLAEQLGVSRASLREAVRVLEHADVLDVRGGSGTYVTAESLSKTTMSRARAALVGEHSPLDLIAVRNVVEPLGAELAASSHHARDLAAMESSLTDHERAIRAGADPSEPDEAFHLAVAASSHNDVLNDIEQYFADLMHQRTWSDLKDRSRARDNTNKLFLEQHRLIYDAIREGNAVVARDRMAEHLVSVQEALMNEVVPEKG